MSSVFRGTTRFTNRGTFVSETGLTTFTGILAVLSTIVGGGLVSIPYSYVSLGIPFAIALNFIVTIIISLSASLYLACKDLIPDKPESLCEIAYMILERKSIFYVAFATVISSFGLMLVYFIVIGDTAA
jgi:amino acid permease